MLLVISWTQSIAKQNTFLEGLQAIIYYISNHADSQLHEDHLNIIDNNGHDQINFRYESKQCLLSTKRGFSLRVPRHLSGIDGTSFHIIYDYTDNYSCHAGCVR